MNIDWRYFSLEQINSKEGPDWKIWDKWPEAPSKTMLSFIAAEAARRQGQEAFERFHLNLLKARHEDNRDLTDRQTMIDVAKESGLDIPRFEKDLDDRSGLERVAADHSHSVETYGAFGTPTLVFNGKRAAYLKMRPVAPEAETMQVWQELYDQIANRPYLHEVKRPIPPKRV